MDKDSKPVTSTIVCPICGHAEMEIMPMDACLFLCDSKGSGAVLRPTKGDRCVFYAYGSQPCPPVERDRCVDAVPRDGC